MADKDPKLAALRSLEESLHRHRCAAAACAEPARSLKRISLKGGRRIPDFQQMHWVRPVLIAFAAICGAIGQFIAETQERLGRSRRRPVVRAIMITTAAGFAVIVLGCGGLWWRLASAPIPFDIATPYLTSAIAENLGHRYRVEIGGTLIELDENRRMAVRMRDVVLRDSDGAIVASAPKAEAGFSAASLLSLRPRAEIINLVGAEVALRIEADGKLTVFAGADKRPIAVSPVLASAEPAAPVLKAIADDVATGSASRGFGAGFAALLTWIDSLGALGLDGAALTEVGLKSGNLVVDDMRNGRQSRFQNIHLSLTRPQPGELSVTLGSQNPERPWVLVAAVKPTGQGARSVQLEARKVSVHDMLLAMRIEAGRVDADLPVSASLRAEIAADGTPQFANGRILVGPGVITEAGDVETRIAVDRLEANLEWDAERRSIVSPFQFVSGGTRITLVASAEAPLEADGLWSLGLRGGSVVIAPDSAEEEALMLSRVVVRGKLDPNKRRLDIQQAEVAGMDVNIATSGFVDFSTADPRLVVGMAARNMSGASFKRMWPPFVNPKVRAWVMENMSGGTVERAEVATNAPLSTLKDGGPPVPDDGLSIELVTNGSTVRLAEAFPPIRDSDLVMRVRGRQASVALGRGVAELPSGRRLTLTNGLFEVPDSHGKSPPARARVRVDGPVPAAAELLATERLRDASGAPLDPATSRGAVSAQIALAMRLESNPPKSALSYTVTADVTNFAVDRFVMSHKIEAQTLRVTANSQGYQIKGDVRIAGTQAAVEYRKALTEPEAEVRLQAVLDDAARARFGFDAKGGVSGPVGIKLAGRLATPSEEENRFAVEIDLAQAKIDNLLPGWAKAAGKPARASFAYVGKDRSARIEDVTIEGSGVAVKGGVDIAEGEVLAASFPAFGLSDGDKASLKAERGADGLLKITIRGDVFDGRAFVKSVMGGSSAEAKQRQAMADFDLDFKVGALTGFNGEALRAVDLKLLLRAGRFEHFSLGAKIGVDTQLIGDLRARADGGAGRLIYFETKDAGALFRFTDTYARMFGGQMWVAMEPPSGEPVAREGQLNVRDFSVRGEPSLDKVATGPPGQPNAGIDFTLMKVEFTRSPGQLSIREGVVRGPVIGATIEGVIDYGGNEVRMRGTFVPFYGLNNAFGQIPIVGLFLGGGANEGLVGLTYEVVGTPGKPILRVNPISALTPGVLRKFMEFPGGIPSGRFPETQSSYR